MSACLPAGWPPGWLTVVDVTCRVFFWQEGTEGIDVSAPVEQLEGWGLNQSPVEQLVEG